MTARALGSRGEEAVSDSNALPEKFSSEDDGKRQKASKRAPKEKTPRRYCNLNADEDEVEAMRDEDGMRSVDRD